MIRKGLSKLNILLVKLLYNHPGLIDYHNYHAGDEEKEKIDFHWTVQKTM
jgi:hypothetical protein